MIPIERLSHERHSGATPTAKENRRDWYALGVLPFRSNRGALRSRSGEAGIRVRSGRGALRGPGVVLPVSGPRRRLVGHAFPPHVALCGHCGVGKEAVRMQRRHRVRVRLPARVRRDTKEASLWVDRIETPIITEFHPANVVADGLDLPTLHGRHEHREVRLAARRRECACDVLHFAGRVRQFHDQHVLSKPAVVARHH